MASKVRLLERLVTSRQISCLHKKAVSCAFQDTFFINHASRIKKLQGCHSHFQSHSTSSSQDPLIHNHGLISSWQTRTDSEACLLLRLQPGDLLEFDREVYCHWAVYVGRIGDEEHCVVHRANPTDEGSIKLSSASVGSGGAGEGGRVLIEPLGSVWNESRVRINNSRDVQLPPFNSKQVVERALSSVEGFNGSSEGYNVVERALSSVEGFKGSSGGSYNVVTNNCEHFASWARNDWALSGQVVKAASKVLQLGVGLAHFKVRPVLLVGMLAAEGLKVVTKRSKKLVTSSVDTKRQADKDGIS